MRLELLASLEEVELHEEGDTEALDDIRAMPVTVLIDRDGLVREIHHGYRPGVEAKYLDRVRALLRED